MNKTIEIRYSSTPKKIWYVRTSDGTTTIKDTRGEARTLRDEKRTAGIEAVIGFYSNPTVDKRA